MPNAHDYRDAARHLRSSSAQLSYDAPLVRAAIGPERIAGGPMQAVLEDALDALLGSVLRAVDELDRLARVCDRRAEICAEYAAELWRHRNLGVGQGGPPPTPPAWWVEV